VRLVEDHVADVDADPELHVPLRLDGGFPLRHPFSDGDRTFERVHDASELGEDAVGLAAAAAPS
jgi:hypothetical protein